MSREKEVKDEMKQSPKEKVMHAVKDGIKAADRQGVNGSVDGSNELPPRPLQLSNQATTFTQPAPTHPRK